MRQVLVVFLFLSLVVSCVPRARIPLSSDQILENQKFLNRLDEQSQRIHSLSGLARVTIRTPDGWQTAKEVIRLEPPGSLRLETWDPMGGLQFIMIAHDGKGAVLVPGKSKPISFSLERRSLKRILGLDFSLQDLFQILGGRPPLPPLEPQEVRVEENQEGSLLRILQDGGAAQNIWMDLSGQIRRWERMDKKGEPLENLVFDDFREIDGIPVPFEIAYKKSDGSEFLLRYQSLFLNQPIEPHLFEIPGPHGDRRP